MNGKQIVIPRDTNKILFIHSIDIFKKKLSLIFKTVDERYDSTTRQIGPATFIYYEAIDLVDNTPIYRLHNVITPESFCPLFNPDELNIHNEIKIESVEQVEDLIKDGYQFFIYDSPNQYKKDIYDYFCKMKSLYKKENTDDEIFNMVFNPPKPKLSDEEYEVYDKLLEISEKPIESFESV